MRIAVIGATGRTGKQVVQAALERGHSVCALARSAAQQSWPDAVDAVAGSILDAEDVTRALTGADAVIVTINMVRTSDFPWARILTPLDLHSRGVEVVNRIARHTGTQRYVGLSAHGVGASREHAGRLVMALVDMSNIGVAYDDLYRAEQRLAQTSLDWTVVRPTRLTNGPRTEQWRVGTDLTCGNRASISRADVAWFLVLCAESDRHLHERVSLDGG